jgi:cyclin G-associated kinase
VNTGAEYAVKRLLGADKEECDNIIREISTHKQLSGHPNIVKYIAASFIDRTQSGTRTAEYLLVSELCKGRFHKKKLPTNLHFSYGLENA